MDIQAQKSYLFPHDRFLSACGSELCVLLNSQLNPRSAHRHRSLHVDCLEASRYKAAAIRLPQRRQCRRKQWCEMFQVSCHIRTAQQKRVQICIVVSIQGRTRVLTMGDKKRYVAHKYDFDCSWSTRKCVPGFLLVEP